MTRQGRNWLWTQLCRVAHRHSSQIRNALKIHSCEQKLAVPLSHGAWLGPSCLSRVDSFTAVWPFWKADAALPQLFRGKRILFTVKCHSNPQWQPPISQRLGPTQHSACFLYTHTGTCSHTHTPTHTCSLLIHTHRGCFYFYTPLSVAHK